MTRARRLRRRSQVMILDDGRRLGYAEWGDPHGIPLVHCHGTPGSRLERHASESLYRHLGVHLITLDRPGFGLSDPLAGRTVRDWPRDLRALMDHLGIERFALMAVSGGAPYALAAAHALPDRVERVEIVSGIGPLDHQGALDGVDTLDRLGLQIVPRVPWAVGLPYRFLAWLMEKSPRLFLAQLDRRHPREDQHVLTRPWVRQLTLAVVHEATRRGVGTAVDELVLLTRPWGFDPAEIRVPVRFWHGDADVTVPLHHAEELVRSIPGAQLTVVPHAGHALIFDNIGAVVAGAVAPLRPRPPRLVALSEIGLR